MIEIKLIKTYFWGISLQLFFALLILKSPGSKFVFNSIDIFYQKILDFSVRRVSSCSVIASR